MFKDIIVCVNDTQGSDNTIRTAAGLAQKTGAQLIGLYIRMPETPPISMYDVMPSDVLELARKSEDERVLSAKHRFESTVSEFDIAVAWREVFDGRSANAVIAYADLVITDQAGFDDRLGHSSIATVDALILQSGKPVVTIPSTWTSANLGDRIVVGWNETRESVRAVQDSLPLMQTADYVELVSVNNQDSGEYNKSSNELAMYLKHRQVNNVCQMDVTGGRLGGPEKVLTHRADKCGADLLVIGGYGHMRFREMILGGVTRYLIKNAQVPVLFSH